MKVQAEIRLRHAELVQAREALGLSQRALADAAGVTLPTIQQLEMLQFGSALTRERAMKVAIALNLPMDVVLPPGVEENIMNNMVSVREVPTAKLLDMAGRTEARLMLPSPEDSAHHEELRDRLEDVLGTLTHREREIIKLRYGIPDGKTHTLEEVGSRFNISLMRARQIEVRALHKLKHPVRSKRLHGFLPDEPEPTSFRHPETDADARLQLYVCGGCMKNPKFYKQDSLMLYRCWRCDIKGKAAHNLIDATRHWNTLSAAVNARLKHIDGKPVTPLHEIARQEQEWIDSGKPLPDRLKQQLKKEGL